jgi:hypothetical protein
VMLASGLYVALALLPGWLARQAEIRA